MTRRNIYNEDQVGHKSKILYTWFFNWYVTHTWVGLGPTTSSSTLHLQGEKVLFELEIIGYSALGTSIRK